MLIDVLGKERRNGAGEDVDGRRRELRPQAAGAKEMVALRVKEVFTPSGSLRFTPDRPLSFHQ